MPGGALNRYYLSLGVGEAVILTHIGKQLLETGVLKITNFIRSVRIRRLGSQKLQWLEPRYGIP